MVVAQGQNTVVGVVPTPGTVELPLPGTVVWPGTVPLGGAVVWPGRVVCVGEDVDEGDVASVLVVTPVPVEVGPLPVVVDDPLPGRVVVVEPPGPVPPEPVVDVGDVVVGEEDVDAPPPGTVVVVIAGQLAPSTSGSAPTSSSACSATAAKVNTPDRPNSAVAASIRVFIP